MTVPHKDDQAEVDSGDPITVTRRVPQIRLRLPWRLATSSRASRSSGVTG